MARVRIEIIDDDGETLALEEAPLFEDHEEIASQAFRVQTHYYNKLDQDVGDWDF